MNFFKNIRRSLINITSTFCRMFVRSKWLMCSCVFCIPKHMELIEHNREYVVVRAQVNQFGWLFQIGQNFPRLGEKNSGDYIKYNVGWTRGRWFTWQVSSPEQSRRQWVSKYSGVMKQAVYRNADAPCFNVKCFNVNNPALMIDVASHKLRHLVTMLLITS